MENDRIDLQSSSIIPQCKKRAADSDCGLMIMLLIVQPPDHATRRVSSTHSAEDCYVQLKVG